MSTHNNMNEPRHAFGGASVKRRGLLRGTLAAGGLAAAGIGGLTIGATQANALGTHPGMLHTQADFDRMASRVAAGTQPWVAGWNRLISNSHSHPTWNPRPTAVIVRGGTGQNYPQLYNDIHAAYQNALRWKVSGSTAHRDKAVQILNAWSGTLQEVTGNADRFLAVGIYGYQFCNAAEIVRDAPGFNLGRFQQMMMDVFYPKNDHFLRVHNGACITNYWANWDLCNMASIMAIGILNDDQGLFDQAVDYFWNGAGNGSINNAIPFIHGSLAQWQESGRDQGHTLMGIGLMGTIMEMAWNQGVDLYSAREHAFARASDYVARYNLGLSVPFTTYSWGTGVNCDYREHTQISSSGRGQVRPVWERVYHHYISRWGFTLPNLKQITEQNSPEGGGGDYGSTSGGFDELGFGTLTYVRDEGGSSSPLPNGVYTLTCERSGKLLDNGNTTVDGERAIQWAANGGNAQRWRITDVGNGHYKLVCQQSGKALDNGNVTTEGAQVMQWTENGGAPQRWRITDVGGAFTLTCERSGMLLDNGNEVNDGDIAIQWSGNGGTPQRWRLTQVG